MSKKLELAEGTAIINQIETLDNKLQSLIKIYQNKKSNLDSNMKEIARIEGLKKTNDILNGEIIQTKKEIEEIKADINTKKKEVEDSGWVVPLPRREITASSMRL